MKNQNYITLLLSLITLTTVLGCSGCSLASDGTSINQFDIKLTDIGFTQNNDLFSPDILSISGNQLLFQVDVTPKDTFTGEPFRTIELGNQDIGYETVIQSTPAVWLVLLSKDGYYFCDNGPLTWTPEELQLPDASERDYYKIQGMKKGRVKHVTLGVSSSDKAVVALLEDSNELARELYQGQWRALIRGDWLFGEDLPKEFDEEYIRSKFEDLFCRHFKLLVVEVDGLQKLRGGGESNNQ